MFPTCSLLLFSRSYVLAMFSKIPLVFTCVSSCIRSPRFFTFPHSFAVLTDSSMTSLLSRRSSRLRWFVSRLDMFFTVFLVFIFVPKLFFSHVFRIHVHTIFHVHIHSSCTFERFNSFFTSCNFRHLNSLSPHDDVSLKTRKRQGEKKTGADPEREFSGPEQEFMKETYDVMLGTFKDYAELTIQVW